MSDRTRTERAGWPAAVALLFAAATATVACGNDPFSFDWSDIPDTVEIFSLARPELNLASGFGFQRGLRVRIEAPGATGTWDAAVDTRDGGLVLLPPGALGVIGAARVTTIDGMTLADVTEAPADSAVYIADEAVPLNTSTIYIIKTNRTAGSFGSSCVYYAKMQPVEIDVAEGTLQFQYVTNPICNSRDLIPPR